MEETWSIGDLATAAGVSARTIRHYEAEGILRSERTEAGHRRFGAEAARLLYEAVALRSLGLGLTEVRAVLAADDGGATLRTTAARQLAALDEQARVARDLRARLDDLVRADPPTPADALEATAMTIALDRITTRRGDDGTTSVAGPGRVAKDDPRIEALGSVDELNAQVGLAVSHPAAIEAHHPLVEIQQRLFDIGADLAAGRDDGGLVTGDDVARLDELVATLAAEQEPLSSFVLPGGGAYAAQLHATRTACRTAERRVVALAERPADAVAYLNRLSDVFFVLARDAADHDVLWAPRPAP